MYTLEIIRVSNENLNRNSAFGLLTTYHQENLRNGRTVVIAFSHQCKFQSHTAPLPPFSPLSLFCLLTFFFLLSICFSFPLCNSPSYSLAVTCGAETFLLIGYYEDIKPFQHTTAINTPAEAEYWTKYKDYWTQKYWWKPGICTTMNLLQPCFILPIFIIILFGFIGNMKSADTKRLTINAAKLLMDQFLWK